MNAGFSCVVCDRKMKGAALKDSDGILCFVPCYFGKQFCLQKNLMCVVNAITNCLMLTAVRPWALADVREWEMRGWSSQQKTGNQGSEM